MKQRVPSSAALAFLSVLALAGCMSVEERDVPLSSPTLLRPGARQVSGLAAEDLLVETANTLTEVPVHTRLLRQLSSEAKTAVVSIYVKTKTPHRVSLLPIRLPGTSFRVQVPGIGLGSGFFIHPSGYLLTNEHVIHNAEEIRILTSQGKDYAAEVLATDPVYDLALLQANGGEEKFPALPMGNSDIVGTGDMVIAIGNPLGLGHTVTFGIVSQTGRNLSGVSLEEARQVAFIQTDASINPGSSGGPLITLTGAWVGVNTAAATQMQGIGFAVPSNQAREFLEDVRTGNGWWEK